MEKEFRQCGRLFTQMTNALIDAGIDIVVVKSTQNQYFMGSRLFEYPELKMLTDAVASSKIILPRNPRNWYRNYAV